MMALVFVAFGFLHNIFLRLHLHCERKRDGKGNKTSDKVMRYALLELGLDHTLKSTTILEGM